MLKRLIKIRSPMLTYILYHGMKMVDEERCHFWELLDHVDFGQLLTKNSTVD